LVGPRKAPVEPKRGSSREQPAALVGDVGATKTLLALAHLDPAGRWALAPESVARFASGDFPHLAELVRAYLASRPRPRWGCFGVPGPVIAGRCRTTNLSWELAEGELAAAAGLERVLLLNDVAALAWAFAGPPPQLQPLREASPRPGGPVLMVAVGTGLGAATLVPVGTGYTVLASEAGHADFAPRNPEDAALFAALASTFGHVSYERVVSGPGLAALYRFFAPGQSEPPSPEEVLARTATDAAARQAALTLARHLGSFVGNAALFTLPFGGVVLAGSVACALFAAEEQQALREAFFAALEDKGRQRQLLARLPVALLADPTAPLVGCARALQHLLLGG
jgi:glucokinase